MLTLRKDSTTVGSIGTQGSTLYVSSAQAGGMKYSYLTATNAVMLPVTTTGVNADNLHDLGTSAARFRNLYLSGGVYLGGTGAANLLDDYEEGSFTPTAESQTGSITSYTSSGYYTKIGRSVTISMTITLTNVGTAAGVLRFGNLIFAPDSTGPWLALARENINTGYSYYASLSASGTFIQAATATNGAIAWTNTNIYVVSMTYTTAS